MSIIEDFVAAGAELNHQDEDGMMPVFWALAESKLPAAVALIEMGADPTLTNLEGDSVASVAKQYAIEPILSAIQGQHGADGR